MVIWFTKTDILSPYLSHIAWDYIIYLATEAGQFPLGPHDRPFELVD